MGFGAALGGLSTGLLLIIALASMVLGSFSGWWTFTQRRHVQAQGTAYVVREPVAAWADDDDQVTRFVAELNDHFRSVREVPGPADLGRWLWPLDQADRWDERVDELVKAFRVVQRGDVGTSDRSLFVWARWPVAVAMMTRLLASERSARPLVIRQRPSIGRMNRVIKVDPEQPGLTFGAHHRLSPVTESGWKAWRSRWLGRSDSAGDPPAGDDAEYPGTVTVNPRKPLQPRPGAVRPGPPHVTILLLRFTNARWGPFPSLGGDPAAPAPTAPSLIIDDAQGLGIDGTAELSIHEWRCPPVDADAQGTHRWSHFEELTEQAVEWLAQHVPGPVGEVVLLGSTMPQEIGLGLGVLLHRLDAHRWPAHVYPLVWKQGDEFVVPQLDLGRESWSHPTR